MEGRRKGTEEGGVTGVVVGVVVTEGRIIEMDRQAGRKGGNKEKTKI